jgi:hypothetical protein
MSGELWRGHQGRGGVSQADLLLRMLREARTKRDAVGLPDIMAAGIAQHGARLNELRGRGFVIENELERQSQGVVHSRYWLRHDPERDGANQ